MAKSGSGSDREHIIAFSVPQLTLCLQKEKSNAGDWNGEDALKAANLAFTAFVDRFSTDTSSWPSCTAPLLAEALDHAFANSHWETIAATIDARQEEVPMDAAEGDTPDDLDNVVGLSQEQRLLIRATRIERKPLVDEVEFLSRRIEKLDRTKAQIVYDIRQARKRPPQERNAAIAAVEARWGEDA